MPPKVFERHGRGTRSTTTPKLFFRLLLNAMPVLALYMKSILFLNDFCIRNLRASSVLYFLYKNGATYCLNDPKVSSHCISRKKHFLGSPIILAFTLSKLANQFCQQFCNKKPRRQRSAVIQKTEV